MRNVMSLLEISKALKTQPFATAEYSANQEGHLTDVWNIAKPVEEQVRNSILLGPSAQVQIFTGANMSGKTYHMKGGFTAHLCAQSVGMVPAAEAIVPVRDAHCYIDRINAESSSGLSAFGTEMAVWGQFLASIKGKHATLCIDEFGSTTSPKYQGHLQYGLLQMLVEDGHTVFLTTHHHDSTERFAADYPDITKLYHFPIQKDPDGLKYTYKKDEGIARSQAIDVAEQQKFPARIIARARELEPVIAGGKEAGV
jgi:DNA mismatch repair protein MutS